MLFTVCVVGFVLLVILWVLSFSYFQSNSPSSYVIDIFATESLSPPFPSDGVYLLSNQNESSSELPNGVYQSTNGKVSLIASQNSWTDNVYFPINNTSNTVFYTFSTTSYKLAEGGGGGVPDPDPTVKTVELVDSVQAELTAEIQTVNTNLQTQITANTENISVKWLKLVVTNSIPLSTSLQTIVYQQSTSSSDNEIKYNAGVITVTTTGLYRIQGVHVAQQTSDSERAFVVDFAVNGGTPVLFQVNDQVSYLESSTSFAAMPLDFQVTLEAGTEYIFEALTLNSGSGDLYGVPDREVSNVTITYIPQ